MSQKRMKSESVEDLFLREREEIMSGNSSGSACRRTQEPKGGSRRSWNTGTKLNIVYLIDAELEPCSGL